MRVVRALVWVPVGLVVRVLAVVGAGIVLLAAAGEDLAGLVQRSRQPGLRGTFWEKTLLLP